MLTIGLIAKMMKRGIFEFLHNPNHGWPTQRLLKAPSEAEERRGKALSFLVKKLPGYELGISFSQNPHTCPDCRISAHHFILWKNNARYQAWACNLCGWVSGPWCCPIANDPPFSIPDISRAPRAIK